MTTPLLALTFRAPGWLWLLLAVVALGVSYALLQLRSRRYAVRFTNLALLDTVAPKRPGWRRHIPAVLLLLAMSCMVLAMAKPAANRRVPRERATIIVAIDTSLSMQATDVAPSRLKAAQSAAKRFIEQLPPRLNVGLVTFNGTAVVRVAPTQDREQLNAAIDQLRLGERTAIGEAIYASLDAIKAAPVATDGKKVPARIVLMSDGETTSGRPDAEASAAAKRAKVPVSTISFGTPGGTIELPGQEGPISVAVNPAALEKIANATGGLAYTASTGTQLKQVYQDIGSSVGYTTVLRDVSEWFVGAALLILLVAAVLSQAWFSRLP